MVDCFHFPLSFGADKAAYNCDNHVSLAHFIKARLCFEHATYLNEWGQINGYMVSFCRSIIFVFDYFSAPRKPYKISLTRCLKPIFVAGKLQFEGATYIYVHGDRICEISTIL